MVVAADESDSSAAFVFFWCAAPHEGLFCSEAFGAFGVPHVDVVDDFIWGGDGGGNWVVAVTLFFGRDLHVEVEFIVCGEVFFHSACDGVRFFWCDVCDPVWVY